MSPSCAGLRSGTDSKGHNHGSLSRGETSWSALVEVGSVSFGVPGKAVRRDVLCTAVWWRMWLSTAP